MHKDKSHDLRLGSWVCDEDRGVCCWVSKAAAISHSTPLSQCCHSVVDGPRTRDRRARCNWRYRSARPTYPETTLLAIDDRTRGGMASSDCGRAECRDITPGTLRANAATRSRTGLVRGTGKRDATGGIAVHGSPIPRRPCWRLTTVRLGARVQRITSSTLNTRACVPLQVAKSPL